MHKARREMSAEDRARFEAFYREHVQVVLRYALARVRAEQAKDVVAETFLVAWRRFDEMSDQPTSWLLGVARKVISTHSRGDARRLALGARLAHVADDEAVCDPGEQVTERQSVLSAFCGLSGPDREVLRLMAWDGLSRDQAAEVLGLTRWALSVRLHRARRRFVARLEADDPDGSPAIAGRPGEIDPSRRAEFLQTKEAH